MLVLDHHLLHLSHGVYREMSLEIEQYGLAGF